MKKKYKIQPNVIADAVILMGLFVGCISIATAPDKKNTDNQIETLDDEAVIAQMTTTTQAKPHELSVPAGDTSFKSYMDYRAITNKKSPQYKLQNDCWTDENGLRRCGDDYVIAVGSYYADYVGERLDIILASGETFTAVVGDFKADSHTDDTHRYTAMSNGGKNVIEFVVDVSSLDAKARRMGDISYINGFDGDIESIRECEDSSTQEV